ncbi:hypothetical protein MTR67_035170 [Solanum verrucosum]|uniref:AIPP2-like SPOC-like domain-containing protein n=1 Tax=Solanum verrucosum TaxID=315347 RepID=A0AAF0U9C8_SOLVR|nr:hypothetical protein MTR67_035170 [Solanum verrucosum]
MLLVPWPRPKEWFEPFESYGSFLINVRFKDLFEAIPAFPYLCLPIVLLVRGKGIEVDETKVKTIRDLPTLKSVKSYCLDKVTFTEYVPWVCDECKENEITRRINFDAIPPVTCVVEHNHAAQPVDDPIWRGCYIIWNNKYTLDGVITHLSDKGSQSVSEKAKLLQLHLHFEMVSKDDLLPKHQDKFDSMVQEMISGEHALRALTPYGELLVFHILRTAPASLEIQTPDNVLAARDVVNDRASTEDDAQVMTDELGRGKRIRKIIASYCHDNKFPIRNSDPVSPVTDLYELDGVVAHLSDKACQSVSEKAKLLLLYLHFEMVSKDELWPEYFNTSEANDDDIELFLFPSEARHQEKFDRLIEDMIGGVYAL